MGSKVVFHIHVYKTLTLNVHTKSLCHIPSSRYSTAVETSTYCCRSIDKVEGDGSYFSSYVESFLSPCLR